MLDQNILFEKGGGHKIPYPNMKIKVYYMLGNNTVYLYVINRHYQKRTLTFFLDEHPQLKIRLIFIILVIL
jgi:hypothetical protein